MTKHAELSKANESGAVNDKTVRVYSERLKTFIEVPLTPEAPQEELLAGMMPVMLVTDHPLATGSPGEE
jgi:hypothetical protein